MNKTLPTIILLLFACPSLFAQKKNEVKHDTTAYYMRNDYDLANSESDAKSLRLIIRAKDGLYRIEDYYMDAKPKLLAESTINNLHFEPGTQGERIDYYPTGTVKLITHYNKGQLTGEKQSNYPNGNFYTVTTLTDKFEYLKRCADSTGKILADNGNGMWIVYDNNNVTANRLEGPVLNGRRDGQWKNFVDGEVYDIVYQNGNIISGEQFLSKGQIFAAVEQSPSYPGGEAAMFRFLGKNIKYPQTARDNKIQGRVVLTFVVERDGTLTEIRIVRSPAESLSIEALRVVAMLPAWKPGLQNGKPVRVQYSMPINFTLAEETIFTPGKSQSGY